MQNLEAVDGEEAGEDALLEAGPEHDDVVLLIHGGGPSPATIGGWVGGAGIEQRRRRRDLGGSKSGDAAGAGEGKELEYDDCVLSPVEIGRAHV